MPAATLIGSLYAQAARMDSHGSAGIRQFYGLAVVGTLYGVFSNGTTSGAVIVHSILSDCSAVH